MKSLNVLVVSSKYPPEYAGSGLRAHHTYKRLSEKFPITFEVLTGSVAFNQNKSYQIEGVTVTRIARKPFPGARTTREKKGSLFLLFIERLKHFCNYLSESVLTWRYLLSNIKRFDVIHVFGKNWVTASTLSLAKVNRKPLIVELCNETPTPHQYEPMPLRIFFGGKFPKYTIIICISEMLRRMCARYGYRENVWSRPNPVDEKKFFIDTENKIQYRKKYTPFDPADTLLIYISDFIPRKNQIFLLDVMKNLPQRYKLLLAGPVAGRGPLGERNRNYLSNIKEKITEYFLDDRVQLEARFIENVDEYLKMSEVFLFPTTSPEGLGTPMLEALSCGIPVIANRIKGVTDYWIKDGKNGYISDLNAREFAKKIEMGLRIPAPVLKQNREELIFRCSTEVIDKQYFNLLKKATKRN